MGSKFRRGFKILNPYNNAVDKINIQKLSPSFIGVTKCFAKKPIFTPFPFGNAIIVDDNRHETHRGDLVVAPTPACRPF